MNDPRTFNTWLAESDSPESARDELNRLGFARQVARGIAQWCGKESLVTALYGPWGSGKTWLGYKIRNILEEEFSDSIRVCEYHPWHMQGMEQTTAELFAVIKKVLGEGSDADSIGSLWDRLGQITQIGQLGVVGLAAASAIASSDAHMAVAATILGSVGGLLEAGKKAARSKAPSQNSLEDVRAKLIEKFSDASFVPLLVVIDDLDRLDDGEIQLLIRLIKTNLNFPKLHFLILGDRDQIARALDPISGKQGARYLEKIVQNPLVVPEPGKERLRGRLREGVERIACEFTYDLKVHAERLDNFWDAFLRDRLLTFRDVHRLLKVHAFHAGCLFKNQALEVDLLDLLGIDFLRIYAAPLYTKLANDPPTKMWCARHAPRDSQGNDRKDSDASLLLLKDAGISEETALAVLVHLFPGYWSTVVAYSRINNLHGKARGSVELPETARPVCRERFVNYYFELDLEAAALPQYAYLRFQSRRANTLEMIHLLEEWRPKGWWQELLSRISVDEFFHSENEDVRPFLHTLASVSDELDNEVGIYSEMSIANRLWFKLFERVPYDGRLSFIEDMFRESPGVSIPLTLLEQLRIHNGCQFANLKDQSRGMPDASPEKIEELTDLLFPQVEKRFRLELFPYNDAWRVYRMAHALGPVRVEKILRRDLAADSTGEAVWVVVHGIVGSVSVSTRKDLLSPTTLDLDCHIALKNHLDWVASEKFWKRFLKAQSAFTQPDSRATILAHMAMAYGE